VASPAVSFGPGGQVSGRGHDTTECSEWMKKLCLHRFFVWSFACLGFVSSCLCVSAIVLGCLGVPAGKAEAGKQVRHAPSETRMQTICIFYKYLCAI